MAKPSLEVFIGADTSGFTKGLKTVEKQSAQFGKDIEKNTKQTEGFGSAMGGLGGIIAGAFAVGSVVSFGKAVIDITAEFQKLEAVLTNTLGSNAAAKKALNQIQEFAATTPYSVAEASQAFLKLANNGIKPTMTEMRAFADVAANAGKSIDMFAEATNDATRGEFERLKEFFISGKTLADKYTFTFKNVTYETEKNATAVKDLLVQLGQLNGVAGATNAISQTLGGQISNLGDAWDKLLLAVGEGTTGIMANSIAALSSAIGLMTVLLQDEQKAAERFFQTYGVGQTKLIAMATAEYKARIDNGETIEDQNKFLAEYGEKLKQNQEALESYRDAANTTYQEELKALNAKNDATKESIRLAGIAKAAIKFSPNNANSPELDSIYIDSPKQTDPMAHLGELGAPTQEAELFGVNEQLALAREGYAAMNAEMLRTQEIGMMIGNELGSLFDSMFNDLAEGVFSWQNFGRQVLATLGKIITKLMTQAIVQAIAAEAPKGILGVATGAVAAAGFTSLLGNITKFADGGIVSGQTMGVMGEYSGAKSNPEVIAPLDKLQSLMKNMGGSNVVVSGETRISGRDLVVVLANENRFTSRTN